MPVLPDGFLTAEGLRIMFVIFNLTVLKSCIQTTFSCNLAKGVERRKNTIISGKCWVLSSVSKTKPHNSSVFEGFVLDLNAND